MSARLLDSEIRAWHGKAPLGRVFWRYGVLGTSVLGVLYATTIFLHQLIAEQILLLCIGLYTAWLLVSIWRCSLTNDTSWALLARFLTVAWAANVAMIGMFRQLELLMLLAGGSGLNADLPGTVPM